MTNDLVREVTRHLARLYGDQTNDEQRVLAGRLIAAVGAEDGATGEDGAPGEDGETRRRIALDTRPTLPGSEEVVLITYADTITEPDRPGLVSLADFWRDHLDSTMSTVHVLPFFMSTSDGGFSIADYRRIGPGLGSWADLAAVAPNGQLMVDLVCNHGSAQSEWFDNFRAGEGHGHDFYLTAPEGTDVSSVVRPRTHDLLVPFETSNGRQHVWATFSADQVDFDFSNPEVLVEFCSIVGFYLDRGASRIRLDAIAYLWKRLGTSCIHLAETHEVVKLFRTLVASRNPAVLITTETNVPHDHNVSYFGDGDEAHIVYNFTLAPLIVWSVLAESGVAISHWLANLAPPPPGCTFLNFIASHDGIGVRPLEGILDDDQIAQIITAVEACGGGWSPFSTPQGDRPYELNVSLTDLLAGQALELVDRFIAAHAIMLSVQGIPAVYVHSLLSSPGDQQAVRASGHKRDINRTQVSRAEIDARLADGSSGELFSRLTALIRLRRGQTAFDPASDQVVHDLDERVVAIERRSKNQTILALHNVSSQTVELALPLDQSVHDLVTSASWRGKILLKPWQVAWLDATTPDSTD